MLCTIFRRRVTARCNLMSSVQQSALAKKVHSGARLKRCWRAVFKRVHPDTVTYNAAISAFGVGSKWQSAVRVFNRMATTALSPDITSFSSLFSAFGRGLQWELALQGFSRMSRNRVEPNLVTWNTLISCCGGAALWESAVSLFSKIPTRRLQPDTVTYNSTISDCGKSSAVSAALTLLIGMQPNRVPTRQSHPQSVDLCSHASQVLGTRPSVAPHHDAGCDKSG